MPTAPALHRHAAYKPREPWVKRIERPLTGRPWRRKRELILKRDRYLCQPCIRAGRTKVAGEVDHVKPIAQGGTDSDLNLQSICSDCHKAKSQVESKRK